MTPQPRLRTQRLPLIHLPCLRGAALFITSSFGRDAPQTLGREDTKTGVCVGGRAEGSDGRNWPLRGYILRMHIPGGEEPIHLEE